MSNTSMRREGRTALGQIAAASNLGQMLMKICAKDGLPLGDIVGSAERAALLKGIEAAYVLDPTTARSSTFSSLRFPKSAPHSGSTASAPTGCRSVVNALKIVSS